MIAVGTINRAGVLSVRHFWSDIEHNTSAPRESFLHSGTCEQDVLSSFCDTFRRIRYPILLLYDPRQPGHGARRGRGAAERRLG